MKLKKQGGNIGLLVAGLTLIGTLSACGKEEKVYDLSGAYGSHTIRATTTNQTSNTGQLTVGWVSKEDEQACMASYGSASQYFNCIRGAMGSSEAKPNFRPGDVYEATLNASGQGYVHSMLENSGLVLSHASSDLLESDAEPEPDLNLR